MADGEVRIDITGDASELLKELEQLKSKLSDTQAQEEQLGKGTSSFGNIAKAAGKAAAAAFATVGTAVAGAATAAVAVGMDFESAMSNVAAISGATGDELQMLSDTAKEMGATTQFSATQAADALSYMALAGWDAQQSVDALPGVLNLAAASGMELASASDMVTDYLSAFGMSCEESTYFADMLAYAQGNANTTAAALGESFKNCASNMAAAGQDVETTTALLSMMANQGLKGSEAGTALAAVMRDLTAKMKDGAIKIGETSVAVQDVNGNYRDLTDILSDVEAATNGMGDAEKAAALSSTFTADSIKGLNMILNAGVDQAADFEAQLRNSSGTAENMAKTALPKVINGFATLVDNADKATAAVAAAGAGFAAWKTATAITSKFSKAVTVLTAAEKANAIALTAVNGGFTASQVVVGVLTGKISLLTAAQSALNAVCALNPYAVIATAAAAAAVGLGVYLSTQETEIEAMQREASAAKESKEAFDSLLEARQKSIDASMLELDYAELNIGKLSELADETGVVREGTDAYKQAKELAAKINAVAPDAVQELEDENGAYLKISDSIDLVIAKKRAEAQISANADAYAEAMNKKIELEEKYASTLDTVHQKYDEWAAAENAAVEHAASSNALYYSQMAEDAKQALDSAIEAHNTYGEQLSECNQTINEQNRLMAAVESDSLDEIKAAYLESEGVLTEYTGANTAACMQQMIDNEKSLESKRQQVKDGIQLVDDETSNLEAATAEQTNIVAQGIVDMIAAAESGAPDAQAASESLKDAMIKGMEGLDGQLSESGSSAIIAAVAAMEVESKGAETVGSNMAAGLYDGLAQALGMTPEQARQIISQTIESMKTEAETHSPSRKTQEIGMNLAQGLANGMSENQGLVTEPAAALAQTAINAVQTGLGNLSGIGSTFAALFSGGISSGSGAARSAASSMASSAASAAGTQRGLFGTSGAGGVTAFTTAIKAGKGASDTAACSIAQGSAQAMDAQKAQYNKAGTSVATQFKTGINSMKSQISSTAKSIATAGHDAAAQTKSQWSSVGGNLAAGLASGISRGASSVISAAVNIARNAISAAKSALGIHSPSRVADKEIGQQYAAGVAQGVERRADDVRESVVKLLDTRKLTLDTVINRDSSGIGERLLSAVQTRIANVSDMLLNNANSRSIISNTERPVYITYAPVQQFDEPITLAQREETNRRDARRIARLVTNA